MDKITKLESSKLSTFRTSHLFENYGEFTSEEEFREYVAHAKQEGLKVYILGNGSNTLFTRKKIRTLVLKNRLERNMDVLDDHRVEVSSSTPLTTVLRHCEKNGLDSFYYLASVPATVGGALAMNAGRGIGHDLTIYDFVESVTYAENGKIFTLQRDEIELDYRQTMFTGVHEKLILSTVLRFEPVKDVQGKIRERVDWSKEVQDHSAPNCGSVFKSANARILTKLRGFRIGKASYSSKVNNWLLNESDSSKSLCWIIKLTKLVHKLVRRKAVLEIIEID